jgi:hypothetical protein
MFITPNMGLTAWDSGSDPYDHSQLAGNFSAIDQADHSPGKGPRIPTAGLADLAVTSAKIAANAVVPTTHIPVDSIPQSRLADDSVGNGELQDNAVGAANIIDGSITGAKLDPTVVPIGSVLMWYRADASVLPPSGWEVMDGRAWSGITNKLGAGGVQWNTGNIPNMSNKFALGAALSGTGVLPTEPPDIGQSAGQHTRDLTHTHTTNAHSHTVSSHTQTISSDGNHTHGFVASVWDGGGTPIGTTTHPMIQRRVAGALNDQSISRQALFVPEVNNNNYFGAEVTVPMETTGAHSHTGATGAATPSTDSQTVTVNNGLTGNTDLRPAFVGFLFIMKVR